MKSPPIVFSPARRAKRCILNLLVCFIIAAGTYLAFHADRSPFRGKETIAANSVTPERNPSPASAISTASNKDRRLSTQGRSSIERALASVAVGVPKN